MSRIDEALARAGSRPAEPMPPMVPPADADGAFAQEPDVTPGVPLEPEVHDPKPVRDAVSADLPLAADASRLMSPIPSTRTAGTRRCPRS